MSVAFEAAARGLLVAHAVLGFTAVLAATHHAAYAVVAATGRPQARALLRFGWIAPATALAQAAAGLALYPTYRVRVREPHFERTAPIVSALFEFKEHLAALGLALIVAAALAGRERQSDRASRWSVAALSAAGATFFWIAAVVGLYVTARHPVGMP